VPIYEIRGGIKFIGKGDGNCSTHGSSNSAGLAGPKKGCPFISETISLFDTDPTPSSSAVLLIMASAFYINARIYVFP
jgi:hypothetical protein